MSCRSLLCLSLSPPLETAGLLPATHRILLFYYSQHHHWQSYSCVLSMWVHMCLHVCIWQTHTRLCILQTPVIRLFVKIWQPVAYHLSSHGVLRIICSVTVWSPSLWHFRPNWAFSLQSRRMERSQGRRFSSPCLRLFQSTLEKKVWQRSPWKPSRSLAPHSKLCTRSTNCLLARGSCGNFR